MRVIIANINNLGGINSCRKIASNMRDFCVAEKLWESAAHIPDISIKEPNKQLRTFEDPTDWQLNPELFKEYCEKSLKYDIVLFICLSINSVISIFHGIPQQ